MPKLVLIFFIFVFPLYGMQREWSVNLKNPEYKDGTIVTHHGGVVTSREIEIQARHIIYVNKRENGKFYHYLIAEGDLMLSSEGNTYVGKRVEYDFTTKSGTIYNGITAIDLWFVGGEKIQLSANTNITLHNAFITTSEQHKATWNVHSGEVKIVEQKYLEAKNVTFRCWNVPIFWLPSLKGNLKAFKRSPVRYSISWGDGPFPKINMRYRIYSWELLDLFLRLTINPFKGAGILTKSYYSPHHRVQCLTRSYLDYDTFYKDVDPNHSRVHCHLQGMYRAHNEGETMHFFAWYDWLNDKNIYTDLSHYALQINPTRQTRVGIRNYHDRMILGINGSCRVNPFQGIRQELPEGFWTSKSFELGGSGIISENRIKVAYLDYAFARDLESHLPHFHCARLSTQNTMYRPFSRHGLTITPLVGLIGIFYGDSTRHRPVGQLVLRHQLLADITLRRHFKTFCHVLQPYATCHGFTRPTSSPDTPYIFNIEDGFNRLNLLKTGIRNLFYLKKYPLFEPNIIADLYAYTRFPHHKFHQITPRIQGEFTWNFPLLRVSAHLGWNIEEQLLDYANVSLAWTISKDFAFKTELRHRSNFHWRRSDPENFIMEATREVSTLLHSPLSDKRNTLLSCLQIKITPQWIARLQSHIGWGRAGEPHYNETKIDCITTISTSWQLKVTFMHAITPSRKNNHFTFALSLVKK